MLTCTAARSKQPGPSDHESSPPVAVDHPSRERSNSNAAPTKQAIKTLSSQIKDMALKASGAYRHCAPCANQPEAAKQHRRNGSSGGSIGELESDRFRWSYRRTGSWSSNSSSTAGRRELEARLKGISSGEGTPAASASGRRVDPVVFVEESEPKEWVAQVEPGVLITFLSLPRGGNELKRIRFSREMFKKWEAQKWWAENCEKVMELYNVQSLNRQAFPLPSNNNNSSTPKSDDDDGSKKIIEYSSIQNSSPATPPLDRERRLPPTTSLHHRRPIGTGYSSPDSSLIDHAASSTPKLSSGTITTTSSSHDIDCSIISNASYLLETAEWVEEDEPGVYITIRALPDGRRQLRRVRFSREKFEEMNARVWWGENRARIHKHYL